jgi:hypothetical protein
MSSRRILSVASIGAAVTTLFVFGGGCGTDHSAGGDGGAAVDGGPGTTGADGGGGAQGSDGGVLADGGGAGLDGGGSGADGGAGPEGGVGPDGNTNEAGPSPGGGAKTGKIDILFDIDNSSSMGDKQQYLQAAIPDLITRLVSPNCVDGAGNPILANGVQLTSDTGGVCAMGQPQFAPVTDMHIGVVTSALGGRGTTSICQISTTTGATPPDYLEYTSGSYQQFLTDAANDMFTGLTSVSKNNDDQGHLINRTAPPSDPNESPGQLPGDFLAWAPTATGDASGADTEPTTAQLETDTQDVIIGAGAFGCGIESQLESWYRFLVQPDPYASITTTKNTQGLLVASWSGVDNTILQQRADFLRPDSAVLIVVFSDENDSEIDVRTIGGIGVNWLDNDFQPPRGTSECAADPGNVACTSCAFGTAGSDSQCEMGVYPADNTSWAYNNNLRHAHMKEKYGIDAQFPINRYVQGLTQAKVPNRSGEYPSGGSGYYQGGLSSDPADLNCDNPLFAQTLPTTATGPTDPSICNLTPSTTRTPGSNLVYYAHIGGVPNELLSTNAGGNITPKETLSAADWVSILGNDPENYDYSGIDPHMIESYQPRAGIPVEGSTGATITGDEGPDWVTDGTSVTRVNLPVDVEYACTFKLATPRNCDPNNTNNPESDISECSCSTAALAADAVPSNCDATNPSSRTTPRRTRRSASCFWPTCSETRPSSRRCARSTSWTTPPATIRSTDTGRPCRPSSTGWRRRSPRCRAPTRAPSSSGLYDP